MFRALPRSQQSSVCPTRTTQLWRAGQSALSQKPVQHTWPKKGHLEQHFSTLAVMLQFDIYCEYWILQSLGRPNLTKKPLSPWHTLALLPLHWGAYFTSQTFIFHVFYHAPPLPPYCLASCLDTHYNPTPCLQSESYPYQSTIYRDNRNFKKIKIKMRLRTSGQDETYWTKVFCTMNSQKLRHRHKEEAREHSSKEGAGWCSQAPSHMTGTGDCSRLILAEEQYSLRVRPQRTAPHS